ncbi:hypothetical protein FOA52_002826 [Chlamydomonas sp. UWO 241]|nr:hypothetical protein FOA52_002826 [Chlamydomonas sp. UWO 241]
MADAAPATEGRVTRSRAKTGAATPLQKVSAVLKSATKSATSMMRTKPKAATDKTPTTACPPEPESAQDDEDLDQDVRPVALDQRLEEEANEAPAQEQEVPVEAPATVEAPVEAPAPVKAPASVELPATAPAVHRADDDTMDDAIMSPAPVAAPLLASFADAAAAPTPNCPATEPQQVVASFGTPIDGTAPSPMMMSPLPNAMSSALEETAPASLEDVFSFAVAEEEAVEEQPAAVADEAPAVVVAAMAGTPAAPTPKAAAPATPKSALATGSKSLSSAPRRTPGLVPRRSLAPTAGTPAAASASPARSPLPTRPPSTRTPGGAAAAPTAASTPTIAVNPVRSALVGAAKPAVKRVSIATPKTASTSTGSMRRPVVTPHPAKSASHTPAAAVPWVDDDTEEDEDEGVSDAAMALATQLPQSGRTTADSTVVEPDALDGGMDVDMAAPGSATPAAGTPAAKTAAARRPASATPVSGAKYAPAAQQFQALTAQRPASAVPGASPKPLTVPVATASYMARTASFDIKTKSSTKAAAASGAWPSPAPAAYTCPRVKSEVVAQPQTDERSMKAIKREIKAAMEAQTATAEANVPGFASDDEMDEAETTYDAAAESMLVNALATGIAEIGQVKKVTLRGVPLPKGSHMHFDDDDQAALSPTSGHVKFAGIPTPKGRHTRFD